MFCNPSCCIQSTMSVIILDKAPNSIMLFFSFCYVIFLFFVCSKRMNSSYLIRSLKSSISLGPFNALIGILMIFCFVECNLYMIPCYCEFGSLCVKFKLSSKQSLTCNVIWCFFLFPLICSSFELHWPYL